MHRDVHIIVPTMGQRLDLLEISLSSLAAQTHPCRVTVVAGGELDQITQRWRGHPRFSVVPEQGRGLSAAINQAWREDGWRSDFTGWLGDDDALPPWSVATAAAILKDKPRASMVHGRCLVVDERGEPIRILRNGWLAARLSGYGMNLIAQPGCLFRTSAVKAVDGLDESLRYAMDVDLYLRLKRVGPIATSSAQLGVFRAHSSGLSTAQRGAAAAEARCVHRRQLIKPMHRFIDGAALPATVAWSRVSEHVPGRSVRHWRP